MKKTDVKEQNNNKIRRSKIVKRLFFDIVVFLIFIVSGTILLNKSLNFESEKIVKYSEKSNLDYKVYLVENEFYDEPYLDKDMLYVANLIDKILIDFDYNFESDDKENIDFDYKIIAKLSINNQTGTKSYFEKSYVLLDSKTVNMVNSTGQTIKEQISLDYPYYNRLANSFKNQFGVESDSKLTVYMLINKKNGEDSNFTLDSSSMMNIVIPLSERSVDIKLDYKEIDETSNIIKKETMTIKDYLPLVLSVVFIIIALIMMVKAMRNINLLRKKKSAYDKYINKILKEYDRLIAESSSLLSFDGKEIININKFTELLDIHDNLQLPIIYYEEKEHELSYFYISHDNVIYLLKIDSNNVENMK